MNYKINVNRHKPSTLDGTDIYVAQKNNNNIGGQTIKLETWSDAVKHKPNGQGILIIDVEKLTERIVDHVINSGVLNVIQQLSIRISCGDPMAGIDYLAALKQLRKIFEAGYRIYWSRPEWSCIISDNKDRTSCVYLDMVYHKCRDLPTDDSTNQHLSDHEHLGIPGDNVLRKLNNAERLSYIQVYSFGISNDFSFDDFIVKTYGCEVHSFDPSMNLQDFRRGNHIWFHNLGLSSKTGKLRTWNVSTLHDIFKDLKHTSRKVNILKMDIENSEWTSLPNIIQTGALKHKTVAC
ncbi:unnamed protein product [Mytilus edulis]|uniref:Methyltransferase domain-containing protein n=1 Tax=Mytilus edulis TaxID=6550 RepID=A0A8S3RZG7_MYTED|nr:unnamed protein product [Mytilus edulis]